MCSDSLYHYTTQYSLDLVFCTSLDIKQVVSMFVLVPININWFMKAVQSRDSNFQQISVCRTDLGGTEFRMTDQIHYNGPPNYSGFGQLGPKLLL